MSTFPGTVVRWTCADGPNRGETFEHTLNADGTITWLAVDGQWKGGTGTEKTYAALQVNHQTWVISYLAASGSTLTAVLSMNDRRMAGFASNNKSWFPITGTFEIVR